MSATATTAAIFLDRDGTIIEDRGHLRSTSEVVFFPETVPSLWRLQRNFKLFIVTNQPGIAEGVVTSAEVARVNGFVLDYLAAFGIRFERVYVCPHRRADGCHCIKPQPYSLRQAAREFGIDLAASFVVGDHPHDVELARNVGATGIYVLTGHGAKHRGDLPADALVAADIGQATQRILKICDRGREPETLHDKPAKVPATLRGGSPG